MAVGTHGRRGWRGKTGEDGPERETTVACGRLRKEWVGRREQRPWGGSARERAGGRRRLGSWQGREKEKGEKEKGIRERREDRFQGPDCKTKRFVCEVEGLEQKNKEKEEGGCRRGGKGKHLGQD